MPRSARSVYRLVLVLSVLVAAATGLPAADPAMALRERFLDGMGAPSEVVFAQSHGLLAAPGSESFSWKVVFKLTYRTADLEKLGEAKVLHSDGYFIRTRKYTARHRADRIWDGRVYQANDRLTVAAFTSKGERVFGHIDEHSRVVRSDAADQSVAMPNLSGVEYNPFTGQMWRRAAGGPIEEQQSFYLPMTLVNRQGELVQPEYRVVATTLGEFALVAKDAKQEITLARCSLNREAEIRRAAGFSAVPVPGFSMPTDQPTTVIELTGEIVTEALDTRGSQLVLRTDVSPATGGKPLVRIDGRFDEWRSVRGIADPQGDTVSYLQYNADTDLLEFKVANDDEYLYFYTRVVGRHGNTGTGRDRYYFYVYIDADRDPTTGYVPTRDDDCYYGVALGDDCEAQFEFISGRFVKTFFGFAGRSTEKDILSGSATIGPSWYAKHDEQGRLRDGYKVEYVRQAGKISITEDFKEGTSDDIQIALSPDGSECEMRTAMSGFLRDSNGKPTIAPGQRIDLAAGVEASGQIHGHSKWGADSTVIVRGYEVGK